MNYAADQPVTFRRSFRGKAWSAISKHRITKITKPKRRLKKRKS